MIDSETREFILISSSFPKRSLGKGPAFWLHCPMPVVTCEAD